MGARAVFRDKMRSTARWISLMATTPTASTRTARRMLSRERAWRLKPPAAWDRISSNVIIKTSVSQKHTKRRAGALQSLASRKGSRGVVLGVLADVALEAFKGLGADVVLNAAGVGGGHLRGDAQHHQPLAQKAVALIDPL